MKTLLERHRSRLEQMERHHATLHKMTQHCKDVSFSKIICNLIQAQ